jgi:hypothetical protein
MTTLEEQMAEKEKELAHQVAEEQRFKELKQDTNEKEFEATEELEKQLEKARKPFQVLEKEYEEAREKASGKVWELQREIQDLHSKIAIRESVKAGSHSDDSFIAWCRLCDVECERALFKKPLANGIQVIKAQKDYADYDFWFAFRGTDLLGFSVRRRGEHRGDETTPYSYIGQTKKALEIKKKNRWGEIRPQYATFTEWMVELGTIKDTSKMAVLEPSKEMFNTSGKGWW